MVHHDRHFKYKDILDHFSDTMLLPLFCWEVMSNSFQTEVCQAPLSFTVSQSLLGFRSNELVMLSNHLILYHPLLLLPSIFPSSMVFSNESALHITWPKYWGFSISPSNDPDSQEEEITMFWSQKAVWSQRLFKNMRDSVLGNFKYGLWQEQRF